jgi:RND family efflux transporter MFP subunit
MRRRQSLPLLLLLPLVAACRPEATAEAQSAEPPRPVQVAAIRLTPLDSVSTHVGTVRARHEVDVGFRASGRITARLVEVGQAVRAGEELARIDPADLALSLRAAEADLAAAEAMARQAVADAARSRNLVGAGHVSAAFDDQRQAAARSAQERVTAARAQLELARNRLDYTLLRAPTSGVVTTLLAEAGQVVTEGQPVLRLADPSERELVVRLPESALAGLAGMRAEASFWAQPDAALPATLREIAPQADGALRTYAARFSLPQAPEWLALGMTGTIRLSGNRAALAAAQVPLSALHDRGAGPMVWRVTTSGRVEAVPVEVLRLSETTAALRGPLREGDSIVAMGPQLLTPNEPVRVVQMRLAATLR